MQPLNPLNLACPFTRQDLGRESLEGAWLWPAMEAAGASNCQQAFPGL